MKTRTIVNILLLLIAVAAASLPMIYWMQNEELSQMQVFKDCWYFMVIAIVLATIAGYRSNE